MKKKRYQRRAIDEQLGNEDDPLALLPWDKVDKDEKNKKKGLTKRLLLEDEEDSVGQLPVLDEVVEVVQEFETLGPGTLVADGVEETVSGKDGNEVLDEQDQESAGGDGQQEVVENEQGLELEGLLALHDLATAKDDDKVGDSPHGNLVLGREWGDALLEDEGVDALAGDELVALGKVGVELDAEGLIKGEVELVQNGGHFG